MKSNSIVSFGFALVAPLITPLAVAQTTPPSIKLDEKAKDAVLGLKKLQSRAEIGVDYHEYSSALADAYFSVKMFLETEPAKTVPEFSNALRQSITWYKTAGDVLQAMQSSDTAERSGIFLCVPPRRLYDGSISGPNSLALCKSHPELVESHTLKDGSQYSAISRQLEKLLESAGKELDEADKYLKSHQ